MGECASTKARGAPGDTYWRGWDWKNPTGPAGRGRRSLGTRARGADRHQDPRTAVLAAGGVHRDQELAHYGAGLAAVQGRRQVITPQLDGEAHC